MANPPYQDPELMAFPWRKPLGAAMMALGLVLVAISITEFMA